VERASASGPATLTVTAAVGRRSVGIANHRDYDVLGARGKQPTHRPEPGPVGAGLRRHGAYYPHHEGMVCLAGRDARERQNGEVAKRACVLAEDARVRASSWSATGERAVTIAARRLQGRSVDDPIVASRLVHRLCVLLNAPPATPSRCRGPLTISSTAAYPMRVSQRGGTPSCGRQTTSTGRGHPSVRGCRDRRTRGPSRRPDP
jgi:hypothetical protein